MAFRMRHWLALVFFLLVGTTTVGLTKRFDGSVRTFGGTPEQTRFMELRREMSRQAWLYQRLQWRDSLVGELRDGVARGESIVLGVPAFAPDSVRDRLRRAVELQFSDLKLETPAMPLGIFAFSRSQGAHPDAPLQRTGLAASDEYYLSRETENPYCIIGVSYNDPGDDPSIPQGLSTEDPSTKAPTLLARQEAALARRVEVFAKLPTHTRATPNTLGLCKYFVRYGEPGEGIMAWLQGGAFQFAESVPGVDHHLLLGRGPARGAFGRFRRGVGYLSPKTLACLAGGGGDCLQILLDPEPGSGWLAWGNFDQREFLAGGPVDFVERFSPFGTELDGLAPYVFFSMEADFGPEKFGEFWRSPLPPAEAFQKAFGEPLDQWAMEWLQRYFEPSPLGPGVPIQSAFLSLLALGFIAGGAVRIGRR